MASSSPLASKHVLALFGPTASGKTGVAGVLRERTGATVISADSAALYAGLPVLTAASEYPSLLVGTVPLTEDVSVGGYQREAHAAIDEAAVPLVVGGTGLYFRAALAERDPAAAVRVHANDRKRVVRALELAEAGASLAPAHDRLWTEDTRLPTTIVALDVDPDELDRRIEVRTRAMVERGVVEEARRAFAQPLSTTARKVLGLEQFATLPVEEAVAEVVQATKRLARYQRKWLRRMPGVVTLDGNRPAAEVADEIIALGRERERLSDH